MLKQFIFYVLLLFCVTANADDVQLTHDTKISEFSGTLSDDQKNLTLSGPLTESQFGCKVAQAVRMTPFYNDDNKYECQGNNNIYNNLNGNLLNSGLNMFTLPFLTIAFFLLGQIFTMKLLKSGIGAMGKAAAVSLSFIGSVIAILFIPFYETDMKKNSADETGSENEHISTLRYLAVYAKDGISASADFYYYMLSKSDKLVFPATKIPNPKNKGYQIGRNLIDFTYCATRQPKEQELKIGVYFSEMSGTFNGSAQIGGCAIEINAAVDPMIQGHAKAVGVDYNAFVGNQFGKALQDAITRANAIAVNIASVPPALPNTERQTYDGSHLERGNEAAYNLTNFDAGGISEYAHDSALNIGEDFIYEMTKYPGVAMNTVPLSNNSYQLCRNVPGATSYFDMAIGIKENLIQCAATMCVDESSPGICGESIEYYNFLANNNAILHANFLTFFGHIMTMNYETDAYKEPAHYFVNSIVVNAYYNNTDSANLEAKSGKKAFDLTFQKKEKRNSQDSVEDSPFDGWIDQFNLGGSFMTAVMKLFQTDDAGILGLNNFFECISHPYSIRDNGWICRGPLNTIQALGHNFQKVGIGMISGAAVNRLLSPSMISKTGATAAVNEGVKQLADKVSALGFAALFFKYAGTFAANSEFEDNYGNYGGTFTNDDVILLSMAYAVPAFNDFITSIGQTLLVLSYFLTLGIPVVIGLAFLTMFILLIITVLSELYFIGPFTQSLNKEKFDETGFFKPLHNYSVVIISLFCIPVSWAMVFPFFDSLMIYKVLTFDALMTFQHKTPEVTGLGDVLGYLVAVLIYVLALMSVCISLIKMATKTENMIRVILLGTDEEDEAFRQLEIQTKKDLI